MPHLAAVGVLPVRPHHPRRGRRCADHGPGLRAADRLPVDREEGDGTTDAHHNLLQRPRDVPVRTAIGAMAIAFYMVLTLAAMNDIIALKFHISLNATTWIGAHRHGGAARDRLLHHLPVVRRPAAQRPRGARARHRDRHHQAAAARRLHRAAPAARPGRRARSSDSVGVPGRRGAQADEQARLRGRTGHAAAS